MFLYIGALFFLILGMYLHEIIPQEYGVSKSPLFPFQKIYSFFFRKNEIITKDLSNQKNESSVSFLNFEQENNYNDEDNDSRNERERVYSLNKENYKSILPSLRTCRSSSENGVSSHILIAYNASSSGIIRAPRERMFASLCSRERRMMSIFPP